MNLMNKLGVLMRLLKIKMLKLIRYNYSVHVQLQHVFIQMHTIESCC